MSADRRRSRVSNEFFHSLPVTRATQLAVPLPHHRIMVRLTPDDVGMKYGLPLLHLRGIEGRVCRSNQSVCNAARFRQINFIVRQGSINLAFENQRIVISKAMFMGLSSARLNCTNTLGTLGSN